jgi:hypothetical protein
VTDTKVDSRRLDRLAQIELWRRGPKFAEGCVKRGRGYRAVDFES